MTDSETKGISPYKLQAGHCYMLMNSSKPPVSITGASSYSAFETVCTFRYEGKQGIHHFFRETAGGWLRTFTNAQFTGRVIKEVEA